MSGSVGNKPDARKIPDNHQRNHGRGGLAAVGIKILTSGCVLLTRRATVGGAAINEHPVVTNQGFQNLVAKDYADGHWLYCRISSMRLDLGRRAAGSTFPELSRDEPTKNMHDALFSGMGLVDSGPIAGRPWFTTVTASRQLDACDCRRAFSMRVRAVYRLTSCTSANIKDQPAQNQNPQTVSV